MKRIIRGLASLLSLVILASCSGEKAKYAIPKFSHEEEKYFTIIGGELSGLNVINDIAVSGNLIIICAYDANDGKFVHVYDKGSGQPLAHGLDRGRGPLEYISSNDSYIDMPSGTVMVYDSQKYSFLKVQPEDLQEFGPIAIEESPCFFESWSRRHFSLDDKTLVQYVVSPRYRDSLATQRFQIEDENGMVLAAYDEFPEYDSYERIWAAYMDYSTAISPDRSKFAVATQWGGILETFSISDNGISPLAVKYFLEPDFEIQKSLAPRYGENTIDSFSDLYAGNDRLYASFGGETKLKGLKDIPVAERNPLSRNILIFDWKGSAIRKIKTDYSISRLCVDDEENAIYAAISDVYGRTYIGKIIL